MTNDRDIARELEKYGRYVQITYSPPGLGWLEGLIWSKRQIDKMARNVILVESKKSQWQQNAT